MSKPVSAIGTFILENSQNESAGSTASKIGISRSYLIAIINGEKTPTVEICNKIADAFGISRISIFKAMGWLTIEQEDELAAQFELMYTSDPYFPQLIKMYSSLKTEDDRLKAIRILGALME